MQIADLGEFALIDRLNAIVAAERADLITGIGDDVAVLDRDGDQYLLTTVDSQIEHVHFLREHIDPVDLGHRALAINLSDIAAKGGRPLYALVSLALPASTAVDWVEALYRGMRATANACDLLIVGGNIARSSNEISIHVTVLGQVVREHLLLRSGAQPGDLVAVTGELGAAAAGLRLLLDSSLQVSSEQRAAALARQFRPQARLAEGALIARSGAATAMLDLSDGLSSDIGHICSSSAVGVRLWAARLPISAATRAVAGAAGLPAWELALSGGEDYELCCTLKPERAAELTAQLAGIGMALSIVGEVLPQAAGKRFVLPDGSEIALDAAGWQHFGERQYVEQ